MPVTLSTLTVPVFVRGLTILSTLLAKGAEHAAQAGMQPQDLPGARLVDDMLPLSAQVQRASDTSKFAVQRISGVAAPSFADDETTFGDLQARISRTIAYLQSVDTSLLDAGTGKEIALNWGAAGGTFTGTTYLLTIALPNFYFHIVTAYDILRHRGVAIGKLDYLGPFGEQ
jgi:hypothetical protein